MRLHQVVLGLQVEPEPGVGAEPVAEAKRRVAGDGALAGDDLADAVGRHGDLARESGRRDPESFEFALEDFAGVDGSREHRCFFPGARLRVTYTTYGTGARSVFRSAVNPDGAKQPAPDPIRGRSGDQDNRPDPWLWAPAQGRGDDLGCCTPSKGWPTPELR